MKEFLTARDIEDLVARGIRQIPTGENIVLTDLARERAAQLGVALMQGGDAAAPAPVSLGLRVPVPAAPLPTRTSPPIAPSLGPKPKGCLHSHIETGSAVPTATRSAGAVPGPSSDSVVDQLIEAVCRLSR
jgi:hypothetical protein